MNIDLEDWIGYWIFDPFIASVAISEVNMLFCIINFRVEFACSVFFCLSVCLFVTSVCMLY